MHYIEVVNEWQLQGPLAALNLGILQRFQMTSLLLVNMAVCEPLVSHNHVICNLWGLPVGGISHQTNLISVLH